MGRADDFLDKVQRGWTLSGRLWGRLSVSGLVSAEQEPAPTPELVRVPVDDEGREILAG